MKNILFLFPTGGPKPRRSAEVMAHMVYDALAEDHRLYLLTQTDEQAAFAQSKGAPYFDLRRYNRARFTILLRLSHILPIAWLLQRLHPELFRFLAQNNVDVILERHGLYNLGYIISRRHTCSYICTEKLAFPDLPYYLSGVSRWAAATFPIPPLPFLLAHVERRAFAGARYIVSKHEEYDRYLIDRFKIPRRRFLRYYAFVDAEHFTPTPPSNDQFVALYTGSFDTLHSVENIVPIIRETRRRNNHVHFRLIGDGPLLPAIRREVDESGLADCCDILGRLPHDEMLSHVRDATVCFETIWSERAKRFGADSIKIYEYMACGKVIIASDLPGQIQRLRKDVAAILVDPTDAERVASILVDIYENPAKYAEYGENAQRIVEEQWNNRQMASVFREAVEAC
jgi:glycosyltransferase involved in cell wall biosynthesis